MSINRKAQEKLNLDLSKIKEGMVIKNYPELCKLLGIEEKESNSKESQIKELNRYVEFLKNKQSFIIKRIRKIPLDKVDNRGSYGNRGSKDELTDFVFGKLTVIEKIGSTKGGSKWLCRCSCDGSTVIVLETFLKNGKVKSCGCMSFDSSVSKELKKYYEYFYNAIPEYKIVKNNKTNKFLRYDIYIPGYELFIEVQGEQHYKFTQGFHKTEKEFEMSLYRDDIKREYAEKNGVFIEIDLRIVKNFDDAVVIINKEIEKIEDDFYND